MNYEFWEIDRRIYNYTLPSVELLYSLLHLPAVGNKISYFLALFKIIHTHKMIYNGGVNSDKYACFPRAGGFIAI